MIQLSPKQARIYEFILSFTQENGYPPSVREIADAVGLKSPSTVHFHLKSLEEAGVITRGVSKTRAITAVHQVERPRLSRRPGCRCWAMWPPESPFWPRSWWRNIFPFDASGEDCFALRIRGRA